MRWYLPLTSFIGYFRRYSPCPCSRSAAPFAQWAPRLIGESNTGSCLIQTPFSTTASTAQPTEQWLQTVRRTSILPPACAGLAPSAASDLRISPSCAAAMPAPTPMPERFRNLRLSMVGSARDSVSARLDDKRVVERWPDWPLRVNSMGSP